MLFYFLILGFIITNELKATFDWCTARSFDDLYACEKI